jgi:hypothetical protein
MMLDRLIMAFLLAVRHEIPRAVSRQRDGAASAEPVRPPA